MKKVVIIGLGGIGSALVDPLVRFLQYTHDEDVIVTLVDADEYDNNNVSRQRCTGVDVGSRKVDVMRGEIQSIAPSMKVMAIPTYIQESNIGTLIREDSYVFLCVDNHPARKLVSDFCDTLQNCVVISGGNEYSDGNAQIFIRKDGQRMTARLDEWHPEIATETDGDPLAEPAEISEEERLSCLDLHASAPQLVFANFFAAASMLLLFYHQITSLRDNDEHTKLGEVFFDLCSGAVSTVERPTLELD